MQLPAIADEVMALERAKDFFAFAVSEPLGVFGVKTGWFDPASGPTALRNDLKRKALAHPFAMLDVIHDAHQGWTAADEALRELAVEFMDRGEPLPTALLAYTMDVVRGRPHALRGPKRETRVFGDWAIAAAIAIIVEEFPSLKPTRKRPLRRSSVQPRASACSIVAAAVKAVVPTRSIDEKAVERLWNLYGRGALADYPPGNY